MSLLRCLPRHSRVLGRYIPSIPKPSVQGYRFKSTTPQTTPEPDAQGWAAQIFRPDRDHITESDVDEWLKAVRTLREGSRPPETETELYLQEFLQPEHYVKDEFVPTQEQLAEVEAFKDEPVPIKTDPTVEHLVNMIMRHGKKSKARKMVSRAFYIVQMQLRKDPVQVLYETLDKMGPLLDTRTEKTGFAKNRVVPFPLSKRIRDRKAIEWILQGTESKKSPSFSVRLAEELINAYEGRSSGYEKKAQMHKNAIAQRAYVKH